ncbi:Protein of unknown function [Dyella jiangningensis]|uniref:phage structural protein n=1 Tax=Dyella sp. AtDHG13 TaxID=1938897 RepID=UPI00088C221D|nr:phage protein [Dyella sp. AtDHG13]PXV60886.1 uncharacterized protein DUF3277 [Dyella sp. AtDHG13]SDK94435.1 Protein of unknown function [Dyella jiangningensis]
MSAYSFLDIQATIAGPGGSFDLGSGAGVAEEGITIEMSGDKNTMTIGADGEGMHSLHADKSGKVTIRLLKTSPKNAQLMAMYDLQATSASLWGQNIISINSSAVGDNNGCREVAFTKKPNIAYAKDGGTVDWVFDCIKIDTILGTY